MQEFRRQVPKQCVTGKYAKDGCSISMAGAPASHVTVDMDCAALSLQGKRCDLLFVGEDGDDAWVAPIELKSGAFSVSSVAAQLQSGANLADQYLPASTRFHFVPVIAHGHGIPKQKTKALRKAAVTLRKQTRRPLLIRCHTPLRNALVRR